MIKPPPLLKGDMIGVMAPSSRVNEARIQRGIGIWESLGYRVYIHPQTWKEDGPSAGTAKQKAKALHDLFSNPKIKAIICARSGNRTATMLPCLDFNLIKKNPKIIMGYSDVTALLNAIYNETGLVTFHGPNLPNPLPQRQLRQCLALLAGSQTDIPMGRAKILRAGNAEGRLVGGNLSLVCALMGTRWQPRFKNNILFLEDCNEELSRIDRMLGQLANADVFRQVSGVMFGAFTGNLDTGVVPFNFTMEKIIRDALGNAKVPAIMNAPFGHGKDLFTFPVGGKAVLHARKDKIFLELPAACAKK